MSGSHVSLISQEACALPHECSDNFLEGVTLSERGGVDALPAQQPAYYADNSASLSHSTSNLSTDTYFAYRETADNSVAGVPETGPVVNFA